MPPSMSGSPTAVGGTAQTMANPASMKTNKYIKNLPESEAKQRARMLSKVSESTGGKSRRVKGGLDQFGRPTGKGELDNSRQEGGTVGALSSSGTVTEDRRNKFDKKFDDQQSAWMDNDDRNDDALYHRSFDDGSMHLYSSAFRDGKPVDNHGKDIGGMGSAPVIKYRRHDLQKGTLEGEAETHTPIDEDNSTLRYFAATSMKEHERGWVAGPHKVPWDPSPYRKVPYEVRGLAVVTNEPWVEAVNANPEINMATSGFNRLDDGQTDSTVLMFQRRKEEDSAIAANRGLIPWHDSPVLWRFPSGQAGRSIEYGETASTLAQEFQYNN